KSYNIGKHFGKDTIWGAVSNGYEWIFIILHLNKDNSDGASFQISSVVKYVVSNIEYGRRVVYKPFPDLIEAILTSWGEKSFDLLDDDTDDWLEDLRKLYSP
ncbi:hypothetical protein BDP27DRAFT_1452194, partial [Rhodocollybia butyracea]